MSRVTTPIGTLSRGQRPTMEHWCVWCKPAHFMYSTPCVPELNGKRSDGLCSTARDEFEKAIVRRPR